MCYSTVVKRSITVKINSPQSKIARDGYEKNSSFSIFAESLTSKRNLDTKMIRVFSVLPKKLPFQIQSVFHVQCCLTETSEQLFLLRKQAKCAWRLSFSPTHNVVSSAKSSVIECAFGKRFEAKYNTAVMVAGWNAIARSFLWRSRPVQS